MDKDLQTRLIFAGVALAIFLPLVVLGGVAFQIVVGILAMLAVHELLRMKGLATTTLEGMLAMLAAFVLAVPIEYYFTFLPIDGNVIAYTLVVFCLLGSIVVGSNYTFDDVVYPIAVIFYVGSGFNALLDARVAGLNKVLLALLIVWATDSGAYLFGRRFGMKKLAPTISPNKTVAGALGGIASAMVVTFIFVLIDGSVAAPHNRWLLVLYAIFFSIAGQFGDLVESAIKRHYGVKDSGKFIPGHGGVLDRFDSLLFVFPLMRILGLF